ncbi:MAG: ABC transporter ATP-binding protein/permease [Candidatus Cloacimonetes bacterium]|nr:ABC transporter ATP-binding protein/permease [Candidatus Cloacimonadota bacterium]
MKNLNKIYAIILSHRGYLIVGFLTMILYALLQGVSITVLVPLFDNVLVPNKSGVVYHDLGTFMRTLWDLTTNYFATHGGWSVLLDVDRLKPLWVEVQQVLAQSDSFMLLYSLSGLVVLLIALKNVFYYINRVCFTRIRANTLFEIRSRMFRQYMTQSLAFFHTNRVGDSLVRMINDVNIVSQYFINTIFSSLRDILTVLVAARIASLLNPRLFLWTIVFLPLFSLAVSMLGKKIKKYAKRMQGQASIMYSNVEEILNSMPVVKTFTREEHEIARFDRINRFFTRYWRKAEIYNVLNLPISEMNSTFVGVFLLLLGGNLMLASEGGFSLGNFTAFLFAIFSMLHPTKNLTRAYTNIRKAMVSLDRIGTILDREPQIVNATDAVRKTSFEQAIELRDVHFAYKSGVEVIKGVNLTIRKGEKIGLVGSSGSGKTTLVNLLNRMYDRTAGSITIDGIPVEKIRLDDLHALFGVVTQESILFSDTVGNNIRYGTHLEVDDEVVHQAARIANADEFIDELPEGYDTMLQTKGGGLSGGQRQRICIARAIVGDPPVLIFDEATSALDTQAERKVQLGIEQATQNRTVVMIAHRLSTILSCDKIVVMDNGLVAGMGTHAELLESCPLYRNLYELQFTANDERTDDSGGQNGTRQ